MKNLLQITLSICTILLSCKLYAKDFQYDVSVSNELPAPISLQYAKQEVAVVEPNSRLPAVNFKNDGTALALIIEGQEYCDASTAIPLFLDLGKTHFTFRLIWLSQPKPHSVCYLDSNIK